MSELAHPGSDAVFRPGLEPGTRATERRSGDRRSEPRGPNDGPPGRRWSDQAHADWRRWEMASLGAGAGAPPQATLADLPTVDQLERMQEQARNEGRANGLAEARADIARLKSLSAEFDKAFSELREGMAEQLLDLALEIARKIVLEALPVRRELLLPVVREAVANLAQGAQAPQLVINPADVETVRAHLGEELRLTGWRIVEDHRIQPGGCRVVCAQGEVDGTLASRWKQVLSALGRDHSWLDAS